MVGRRPKVPAGKRGAVGPRPTIKKKRGKTPSPQQRGGEGFGVCVDGVLEKEQSQLLSRRGRGGGERGKGKARRAAKSGCQFRKEREEARVLFLIQPKGKKGKKER